MYSINCFVTIKHNLATHLVGLKDTPSGNSSNLIGHKKNNKNIYRMLHQLPSSASWTTLTTMHCTDDSTLTDALLLDYLNTTLTLNQGLVLLCVR